LTKNVSENLILEYLWGGTADYRAGATLGPRTLEDYELVWIVSGQVTYVLDGRDVDAPPGTILLARPGFHDAFRWDPEHSTRHAFLHFAAAAVPGDWPPSDRWPAVRRMVPGDSVRPLFRRVLDDWCDGSRRRQRPPRRVCRTVEALVDSFLTPTAPSADEAATPTAVERALDWLTRTLEGEPDRRISLAELAAAAAVTPKHLCRLFAGSLGRSPMQTVRLMRLERSLLLLARSNLTVREVAGLAGFASAYHFSRCFRAAYGSPPSAVRRALLAGDLPPASPFARSS